MLWIIEQAPGDVDGQLGLSDDYTADRGNLAKNPSVSEHLANQAVSYSRADCAAPFPGRLVAREPIYVLAHAGLQGGPSDGGHVAGLGYKAFGNALAQKFGGQLTGRPVILLVCYVGKEIAKLGQAIADSSKGSFQLYAPTGLMYINSTGVPLVLKGDLNVQAANARVQQAAVRKHVAKGSLACGVGWAGTKIEDSTVVALADKAVLTSVAGHFGH